PSEGRVVAFTAVPRDGYDGPVPRNRFINEGPHAAATAALYPNMDHVLIRGGEGTLPFDVLDRFAFAIEAPLVKICNSVWGCKIFDAARERKLKVILDGSFGNIGLSYDGIELLSELFLSGRWLRLWKESRMLVRQKKLRWRGIAAKILGP